MEPKELFAEIAKQLQRDLAWIDLLPDRGPHSQSNCTELLLVKLQGLKVKMYQEQKHTNPHLHIDYGRTNHAASYALNPPSRLEGALDSKYDASVLRWINDNRVQLLEIWGLLQSGNDPTPVLASLRGNA